MDILEAIVIAAWGFILGCVISYIAYQVHEYRESGKRLAKIKTELDELYPHYSWASVRAAQAAFNVDFFSELNAHNDMRLYDRLV